MARTLVDHYQAIRTEYARARQTAHLMNWGSGLFTGITVGVIMAGAVNHAAAQPPNPGLFVAGMASFLLALLVTGHASIARKDQRRVTTRFAQMPDCAVVRRSPALAARLRAYGAFDPRPAVTTAAPFIALDSDASRHLPWPEALVSARLPDGCLLLVPEHVAQRWEAENALGPTCIPCSVASPSDVKRPETGHSPTSTETP